MRQLLPRPTVIFAALQPVLVGTGTLEAVLCVSVAAQVAGYRLDRVLRLVAVAAAWFAEHMARFSATLAAGHDRTYGPLKDGGNVAKDTPRIRLRISAGQCPFEALPDLLRELGGKRDEVTELFEQRPHGGVQ